MEKKSRTPHYSSKTKRLNDVEGRGIDNQSLCHDWEMISPFKKVSIGDMRGWVREELFNLLSTTFFEDPVSSIQKMGGHVVSESKLRWAAILTLPNRQRIFFKRDMTKDWLEALKFLLLPSKARKEWFIAYQLRKRNLPIPKPLGWMERMDRGFVKESYYLSGAIGSGVSLIEDFDRLKDLLVIGELAQTVKKVHDSGLYHQDLHAGNFLWDGESIFLTDLHRTKILKSLSVNQRLWNLSQLFHSLRFEWSEVDQTRFFEKYIEGGPLDFQKRGEYLQKIYFWMERLQRKQWKSRTKRCLRESTEFFVKKELGVTTYHRKDFSLDLIQKVIEDHRSLIGKNPSALIKNSKNITVSILGNGRDKVCVKRFCYPHLWDRFKEHFRQSKGIRAWVAGHGLRVRNIPSLKPLALVERRNWLGVNESFFLMEALEAGQEMDRYILKGFDHFHQKRGFIKTFAHWLSNFHQMGLFHKDMKACNIFVSKNRETWNFYLLDLEDVRLDEEVDEKKLFKNLLQLNTSIPKTLTRTDRLKFFREYVKQYPTVKNEEIFLYRLMGKSRARGVVYVSPEGVVEER